MRTKTASQRIPRATQFFSHFKILSVCIKFGSPQADFCHFVSLLFCSCLELYAVYITICCNFLSLFSLPQKDSKLSSSTGISVHNFQSFFTILAKCIAFFVATSVTFATSIHTQTLVKKKALIWRTKAFVSHRQTATLPKVAK